VGPHNGNISMAIVSMSNIDSKIDPLQGKTLSTYLTGRFFHIESFPPMFFFGKMMFSHHP